MNSIFVLLIKLNLFPALTFLIPWWIFPLVLLPLVLLGSICCLDHLDFHLHGPVQQHDGEDEDGVQEGQDAAYLTNLLLLDFC